MIDIKLRKSHVKANRWYSLIFGKNELLIDVQISNESLRTTYHFVFVVPLYTSTDKSTFPLIFCVEKILAIYKKKTPLWLTFYLSFYTR